MKNNQQNNTEYKKTQLKKDDMPWVSVIMPVYNSERFLVKSVLSVLEQTYKNIELICINDGSTDMSLKLLNKIKNNYPDCKMIIISQENLGPASARNKGLNVAVGEYISFVDSDDYLEPNTYDLLINNALKNSADIIVFGGMVFPEELPQKHWITQKLSPTNKIYDKLNAGKNALLRENSSKPFIWQHFIKRELIEKEHQLRMDENFELGEDQIFIFSYFPRAKKVVYINNKLYHYRVRGHESLMVKYNNMRVKKFNIHLDIVRNILNYWKENNISDVVEIVSYFLLFLYDDFKNFPKYLKIKYASEIIEIFESQGYDISFCDENVYEIVLEIKKMAQKENIDIMEELKAKETRIKLVEEEITLTMSSKAYKIGRLFTPKKMRVKEDEITLPENKKIF